MPATRMQSFKPIRVDRQRPIRQLRAAAGREKLVVNPDDFLSSSRCVASGPRSNNLQRLATLKPFRAELRT
jgi:hypothetical protein